MSKVYVMNKSGHDFSDAEKHGELVYLTEGKHNIFSTGAMIQDLKNKLRDFKPSEDFLLMSGSPFVAASAMSIILTKIRSVNVLLFDAKNRVYVPRTVNYGGNDGGQK